jgi:hypothetical protein
MIKLPACHRNTRALARKEPGVKNHFILLCLLACAAIETTGARAADPQESQQTPAAPFSFYHNLQYGFCLRLPWSYFIIGQTWRGTQLDTHETVSGPELLIRSRAWTVEDPLKDIPIMIFTPSQWQLVVAERLTVSAAPIGPSELGRTKDYVFALPPRWIGFTGVKGQDEVQALMNSHPFQAPCEPVVYRNTHYGFCFLLPADWEGYKIFEQKSGDDAESFPILTIRNAHWSTGDRWQDIPIMIFTPRQWRLVESGGLAVSPAPIGPGYMGRNTRYVFALPPRWIGYADTRGQDELMTWISQHPFRATCQTSAAQKAE